MIGAVPEELARGRVDPVGAAAEIDAVEIELEDLILAELALEREREDALLDLADEGPVVGQEDVARELLGDGRAALAPVAGAQPNLDGARDSDRIDARDGCGSAGPRWRRSPRASRPGSDRRAASARSSVPSTPAPGRWRRAPGSSGRGRCAWSVRRSLEDRRSRPRRPRPARAGRAAPHRRAP